VTSISVCSVPAASGNNPYIIGINARLEELGVSILRTSRGAQDIRRSLFPGLIVHFHWPSRLYTPKDVGGVIDKSRDWRRLLDDIRAAGAHIVWTVHNVWPHERSFPELDREARRLLVERADHLITHGEYAAAAVIRNFGQPRALSVIPHPCYEIEHADDATRRAGPAAGLTLLAFGMLRAYKNLEFVVTCFRRSAGDLDRLVIAGARHDSYDTSALRTLCAEDRRIHFIERDVSNDELRDLCAGADAVVFGYTEIASSGTVALAQSLGKPVVAPRVGCIAEMVPDDVGELYDAGSSASFAQAIERLRGRDLERMGSAARDLIRRQTPATFARTLFSIYAGLAAPPAKP
jgi:glycosyltransferase involved in cell wall biosynthesis